jgi:hypothetical protein
MAGEVSVERGLKVSIVGGCHDCHTDGYRESEGKIDLDKALKGSGVGWRGPWGTTYAGNLRLVANRLSEGGFVLLLSIDFANVAAHAVVQRSGIGRERRAVPLSLHQVARRSGQGGARGPWPRRRTSDSLCRARAAAAAEGLQKGLGLRRRAGVRPAGPLCSEVERRLSRRRHSRARCPW